LAETSAKPWRRYLGAAYETEQWTKAHEGERPKKVEAGNRGLKMDIESGSPLDALDATYQLRIEVCEAGNINVIARASDDKINLHSLDVTFAILKIQLDAIARTVGVDQLVPHMNRHFPLHTVLYPPR